MAFLSKKVWTKVGLVDYFVLFFIHVDTRKVYVAGITARPDAVWMAQQARNLCMVSDDWRRRRDGAIRRASVETLGSGTSNFSLRRRASTGRLTGHGGRIAPMSLSRLLFPAVPGGMMVFQRRQLP